MAIVPSADKVFEVKNQDHDRYFSVLRAAYEREDIVLEVNVIESEFLKEVLRNLRAILKCFLGRLLDLIVRQDIN
jgi:hypothetical protein